MLQDAAIQGIVVLAHCVCVLYNVCTYVIILCVYCAHACCTMYAVQWRESHAEE